MCQMVQDLNRENTETLQDMSVLHLKPFPVVSVELIRLLSVQIQYFTNTYCFKSYEIDKTEQFVNIIYGLTEMLFSHLIHL